MTVGTMNALAESARVLDVDLTGIEHYTVRGATQSVVKFDRLGTLAQCIALAARNTLDIHAGTMMDDLGRIETVIMSDGMLAY